MTENDLTKSEKRRLKYMDDDKAIDIYTLMKIAKKLKEEDTSLNIYRLYKHPEVRIKLFSEIIDACYTTLNLSPTQPQKLALYNYLEQQYETILKKVIVSAGKHPASDLLDALKVQTEIENQLHRDLVACGIIDEV